MTKIFTLLTALLLLTQCSVAQKGFHIGASGTFNSTWILNQNNYGTLAPFTNYIVRTSEMDYKYTWGGNAGVVLGYNFTPNWGIKGEIQYNITGQRYEDNFEGPAKIPQGTFGSGQKYVNVQRDITLHYVQIPILAKYTTSPGHVAKFFIALGPQIGVRTLAKEQVKVAGYVYDTLALAPNEKFKSTDLGFALQFGTEVYATDNLYFAIGLSFYGGVTDLNGQVLKTLGWYSQNDVKYQRSYNFRAGLMTGIHYLFGRGREY